ncbi:tellurite resistance TerB family protein [Cyanobium sp. FGCU-52]|nr:tellurite resistance TerB family protein [Cyanobium sp. FGCU52]
MTPREAFAAIALVAVACDGTLDRQEAHALREQLEGRHPYRQASEEEMGNLFDGLLQRLRSDGWQQLLAQSLAALNGPQQETALAMAAQLVHSDRVVQPHERELLAAMAEQLVIGAERAQQILEVIEILHRDSLAA